MTSLSGGQAARANLASLLLSRYDIFLLDEPTNDLDIEGLAILEDFVVKLRAGTVLVSHDRAFLERTVDQVLELDLAQQSVHLYSGGYLAYLEERAIARQHARDAYEKYADQKAALTDRMRTQSSWADRGVRQARAKAPDKDKHRLSAQVNRTEKLASKIKITERMLERLEVVEEPRKEWELRMTIAAAPRSGTVAASLRDAVVSLRRLHTRTREPAGELGGPGRYHRTERSGQVDADRRAARAGAALVRFRVTRVRDLGGRGGPGTVDIRRSRAAA